MTSQGLAELQEDTVEAPQCLQFVGSERVRNQLGLRKCVGFHII